MFKGIVPGTEVFVVQEYEKNRAKYSIPKGGTILDVLDQYAKYRKVVSVGRKYFTVNMNGRDEQFEIINGRQKGDINYCDQVYDTKEDYVLLVERELLWNKIRHKISNSYVLPEISYDDMQKIAHLLKIY